MPSSHERHIVVVGAGINGATIAWYLSRSGKRVTIVDAAEIGGVATPCSFGWINSTHGFPREYFDLRMASMAEWKVLAKSRPGLPYFETGGVYLHFDGHDGTSVDLSAFAASHAAWGYDIAEIAGEELRGRAPHVRELPEVGLWAPCESVAEGTETAQLLLKDCVALGATVIAGLTVEALTTAGGRVTGIATRIGTILADEVVVAAGAATPTLLRDVAPEVPLTTPRGILAHTQPYASLIPHLTLAKDLHVRQTADGRIMAGWDFGGGGGPDAEAEAGQLILQKIRRTFHGAADVVLAGITVGYRPTPRDGYPVVGRPGNTPGLVIAVMHSGITLAPIVGQAVSHFIDSGDMHELLRPYGPERFETNM